MTEHVITKWGSWWVTQEGQGWKQKILQVNPGKKISLQYHNERSEGWIIVSGTGNLLLDNGLGNRMLIPIEEKDTFHIEKGFVHQVKNTGKDVLIISEIQWGNCYEEDIVRLPEEEGL